jgi:PAS domain S-box-containing protein
MSDEEEYTNLDLETAEQILFTAGKPELAKALHHHAHGVRNLVQGEWGKSFVGALENIMDTRVLSVLTNVQLRLDEQIGLVQQILTTAREAKAIAQEALSVSKAGAARLGKMEKGQIALNKRQTQQYKESQADRADLRGRINSQANSIEHFGHELAEFKTAIAVFNASMLLSANAQITIDADQVIVRVNRKVQDYFGYTDDELVGQPLDVLIPEAFREAHRAHIEAFAQSTETERLMADRHQVHGLHKDGTEFPIRAAILKDQGGFVAVVQRAQDDGNR